MDEKFWQRFEDTLDRKLEEKLEKKLDEKLDKKLDEKLDKKFEINNNKLIEKMKQYVDEKHEGLKQYVDEKHEGLKQYVDEKQDVLKTYIDEKMKEEHQKTVSAVAVKLGEIVDIVGEQIEEVKLNQKCILRELRGTRKELTARLNFHDYRLEQLEEKVG